MKNVTLARQVREEALYLAEQIRLLIQRPSRIAEILRRAPAHHGHLAGARLYEHPKMQS